MKFLKIWEKSGIYIFTVIVFLAFWILLGNNFVSAYNLINVLLTICLVAIGGIGIVFIITCGLTDMSIGSVYTMTTIVVGLALTKYNLGVFGAIALSLIMGIICGLINGILVLKAKIPAFVTTLATRLAFLGVSYLISGGKDILYISYSNFKQVSAGKQLGVPNPIWIMAILVVVGDFVYKHTRFGTYVRAIGSNISVTKVSGVATDKTCILCYVCSAIFATLGGILCASRTLIGTSTAGSTYTIDCICAAVLGGTSMSGGKGNVYGMFFAALLLGFVKNALNMLNLPFYYQYIVTGTILVFALFMGNLRDIIKERQV